MRWLNFLHFYQPSNIDAFVIKEATEKSYLRIIRALEEHPQIKFTFNITGCLILRWEDLGYADIIKRIERLAQNKQVELVGSASYHPILPLIPEKEVIRQIKDNEDILGRYFGVGRRRGFFFPEMAYGVKIGQMVKKLGYKYLILDEISYNGKLNQVDFRKVYKDKNSGLKVVFRSRKMSNNFAPKIIKEQINKNKNNLVITATDAELYGLRYIDHSAEFERLLKRQELKTLTLSEFINNEKPWPAVLVNASWESTEKELKNNLPYALWYNKKNNLQMKLWQLADLAYRTCEKFSRDPNYYWARWHLVRGLASCTFWWASGKDFREVFGPISWGPDEIERGTNELIRSIRSLDSIKSRSAKIKAEKIYNEIRQLIWSKHWQEYWKKT